MPRIIIASYIKSKYFENSYIIIIANYLALIIIIKLVCKTMKYIISSILIIISFYWGFEVF